MDEPMEKLESELSSLRPRRMSPELAVRIAAQLERSPRRMSFADRCLAAFMASGSLAACVIVGLLTWGVSTPSPSSSTPPQAIAARPAQSIGEYQQALARSDGPTLELFR
jgi:hypothetical protein